MGWEMPWYSAQDSLDTLLVGRRVGMMHIVCYLRQGSNVFETYWTTMRGVEAMDNSYRLLDLTVYGRQETWEDSPTNWPQRFKGRGRPTALVKGLWAISISSGRARNSTNCFASRPRRSPCGSVKPPTSSSCDASHFILSQYGDRRCSYGESRRLAITPSHPSRQAVCQGFSPVISATACSGDRTPTWCKMARRSMMPTQYWQHLRMRLESLER
jgi:hypothetical protein